MTTLAPAARAAAGGLLTLTLTLAGCAAPSPQSDPDTNAGSEVGESPVGRADIEFAQMMIVHHREAIEMVSLAPQRTTSPEVLTLAAAIAQAQGPEIDTMSSWLRAWGAEVPADGEDMDAMNHGPMPGDMTEQDMAALDAARGAEFDTALLTLMIEHHRGAIEMAQEELASGVNAEARALAERVIADQSAEIMRMEAMLAP